MISNWKYLVSREVTSFLTSGLPKLSN